MVWQITKIPSFLGRSAVVLTIGVSAAYLVTASIELDRSNPDTSFAEDQEINNHSQVTPPRPMFGTPIVVTGLGVLVVVR